MITVKLPRLHPGQQNIQSNLRKYNVVAMGRRWGKSTYLIWMIVQCILKGKRCALWVPYYNDYLPIYWSALMEILPPKLIASSNKSTHEICLRNGGYFRIYSTEKPDSGRGEKFHLCLVDEAGVHRDLKNHWEAVIQYTMEFDDSKVIFAGTPMGKSYFYHLSLKALHDDQWITHNAPSFQNPHLSPDKRAELEAMDVTNALVRQEVYAEFLDDGGSVYGPLVISTELTPSEMPVRIAVDVAKSVDWCVASIFNEYNQQVEIVRWQHINWDGVVEKIISIVNRYPGASVIVDKTGVGASVVDHLEAADIDVEGFIFGEASRMRILEHLALLVSDKNIQFLPDDLQTAEFEAMQRRYHNGKSKIVSSAAHDDYVMAAAMAMHLPPPQLATVW